jgi:hypothetical protein
LFFARGIPGMQEKLFVSLMAELQMFVMPTVRVKLVQR